MNKNISDKKNQKSNSITNYLFPRLQDIIFVSAFYLILILGTNLIRDGDTGRHITLGKYMIENRTVITKDLFSYTIHSKPIAVHEWFSEVVYGGAYLLMGLNGVILVAALVLSTTFVLVFRELIDRETPHLLAFGLAIWAIWITMIHWLARPHIFSYLFLALYTPLIGKIYRGKDVSLLPIAATMLFWANSHGGFIYGFAVWMAYMVGWVIENRKTTRLWTAPIFKKLLAAGGISFLATFINPAGWHLWEISLGYSSQKFFNDRISEWRSVDFHSLGAFPFWVLLAVLVIVFLRSDKKTPLGEAFLLGGYTALGIYSVRNIPPYAVVVIPLVGIYFVSYFNQVKLITRINHRVESTEYHLHGIFWTLVATVAFTFMLFSGIHLDAAKEGYKFNSGEFPVEAVDWLEKNPLPGNMFNQFRWGGYLIYRLWPNQLVFMDGQTEFFGEQLTRQHDQILDAQDGWENVVEEYHITWMIVPVESRIALLLGESKKWNTVYRDKTTAIFQIKP